MLEDIRKIIEKNLPAEVGKSLQTQLERIPMMEATINKQQGEIKSLSVKVNQVVNIRSDQICLEQERKKLIVEQEELKEAQAQFAFDLQMINLRKDNAFAQRDFMQNTMTLMLGNRKIRETIQDNVIKDIGDITHSEYQNSTGDNKTIAVRGGQIIEQVEKTTETEEA